MEIEPRDEVENGPSTRIDSISSSTSALPRRLSDDSSDFSDLLNTWEAELDALEATNAAGTAGASTSGVCSTCAAGGRVTGAGGSGPSRGDSAGSSAASGVTTAGYPGGRFQTPMPTSAAASPGRPTSSSPQPATPAGGCPPPRRSVAAGAGGARAIVSAGGATKHRLFSVESSTASFASLQISPNDGVTGGSSTSSSTHQHQRRRAAFVAGSVNTSTRKLDTSSAPRRDILLPRLPGPALDLIVPALPPATRAALRCASKGLRALVDSHTHSLTLRPDRRVAEALNGRGTKAFALFPALRHVTVVLAGSCSCAAGPAAAAQPPTANTATAAAAGRRLSSAASASATSAASAASDSSPPLLSLSGWLVVCGSARCLTSLTMHVGEVALLEDLALSVTHPHLQRLDLFIGRSGNPHASPPAVQFMVGVLPGLRHLGLTWAGGPGAGGRGGGAGGGGGGGAVPSLALLAHGHRRLFLDGRPRLGPLLLAALGDLTRLESLELRGFLIDTEGHAVLARHWPLLAGRLRRLVLCGLHLMVPMSTPPGQQLGELVGQCVGLRELLADLCLPASAGMPGMAAVGGGPGGAAAAALLLSLMYASRDVRAMRPEMVPASLTRLSLPGVCLTRADDLAPLSRLRSLTSLKVTALGPGAGEYLTALQELRLIDCQWRQLLDMLPWRPADPAPQQPAFEGPPPADQPPPPAVAAAAAAGQDGGPPAGLDGPRDGGAAGSSRGPVGPATAQATPQGSGGPTSAVDAGAAACGQLRVLEVLVCERLDDWLAPDRGLLARVGRALLPLVDGGCKVRLKVSEDAQPHIWNESDEDGKPWEPTVVWRHIKAAQNLRRLQAETKAAAERLARGRLLQAARRKDKELHFVER